MKDGPRAFALIVEYDGAYSYGMQRQSELPTVAGALDASLGTLLGHQVRVVSAGRTDAGVHATAQVVSFSTTANVDLHRLPVALSGMLRESHIAVLRAVERPPEFSARRDALARTYRYKILNRPAPSPLQRGRSFHVGARLDVAAMEAAAVRLVGEHDFAAFCATPPARGVTRRNVTALAIEREGERIDIWMTADSFLHNMVRIVVGTLIEVGRGRRSADDIDLLLAPSARVHAGFTAPAHGLYLERVHYAEAL